MRRLELVGWLAVAVVLCALAIPWFLWGDATIVAGLPVWLWWHIGWMGLASVVFWLFAQRAWGLGIETESENSSRNGGGSSGTNGNSSTENGPNPSARAPSGGERP